MIKASKLEICVSWVLFKIVWHSKCCNLILDFFSRFQKNIMKTLQVSNVNEKTGKLILGHSWSWFLDPIERKKTSIKYIMVKDFACHINVYL